MTTTITFSRQNDGSLRACIPPYWENLVLVVVRVLESKGLYWDGMVDFMCFQCYPLETHQAKRHDLHLKDWLHLETKDNWSFLLPLPRWETTDVFYTYVVNSSLKWAGIVIRISTKCLPYNYRDKENVWKKKVDCSHFATPSLVSPRNDVWARKKCRNSILMTCHYPNLGSAPVVLLSGW